VTEIKSALMMSGVTAGVTKEDQNTPADPFDRGAGRVQVDSASSVGLVMNETAFQFLLADPADGGDPKTLNLASYKNYNCVGTCSFQRKFRSVASVPVDYTASLTGVTGTVSPASFTANPGQTVTLNVEVDGASLPAGAVSFGELSINEVPSNFIDTEFEETGLALAVPDDGYDGSLGSMACTPVTVSGITSSTLSAAMELAIDHTWVGDMTVKLENPNGDVLGVMSRPGFAEPADDGTSGFGDSSNLLATSPVIFSDDGLVSAEAMGGATPGGSSGVVCQDDAECEFTAAPDTVAQPPGDFASLASSGDPNGDWNVCVGDSGGGDLGTVSAVKVIISEAVTTYPSLHLPLVITGFPEQPDIDVTPLSLAATIDADMTTDLNLNIANSPVAGADLNWTFGSGNFSLVYAEQTDATNTITNGIISGFFVPDAAGAYSADDFVLSQDASIETMFFEGFANGTTLDAIATSIQLHVYADAAGVPDGHPEDGLNNALFTLDIPIADPSLDLTDNNIAIDIVAANGGSLDLPAGTYWVSVFPTETIASSDASRWNWFAAGPDVNGAPAQLVSPVIFSVPNWSGVAALTAEPNFEQLTYNIAGSSQCGAPWITTSVAGGAVVPGADTDVTVTLDSTGLTPGVYGATLCIDSDDPDEPQVLVDVTLTVDGPSDLIFEDGFE